MRIHFAPFRDDFAKMAASAPLRMLTDAQGQRHVGRMSDDLNEEAEERWCAEQREMVITYLVEQGLNDPNVGELPAWHVAPVVAVWAVESKNRPDWVGWWAVSGDIPTDYTTCGKERHPREALRDIGERWSEAAAAWSRGERYEVISLGSAEREEELAPLLKARGKMFIAWAADDNIWLN